MNVWDLGIWIFGILLSIVVKLIVDSNLDCEQFSFPKIVLKANERPELIDNWRDLQIGQGKARKTLYDSLRSDVCFLYIIPCLHGSAGSLSFSGNFASRFLRHL